MLNYWIPWKFLIKRAARAHGIIDPLTFLARFRQFSQPSEVQEPIELLRAGIAFHARGVINTKAIQHNLDWVWPYWVERQFNPNDVSFIPRAFSFSHINLTHRNWTAVGHPDLPLYPLVDPKGLVTPFFDGWSIDLWVVSRNGGMLLPSKLQETEQQWILSPNLAVETISRQKGMELKSYVTLDIRNQEPVLDIAVTGRCSAGGWIIAALRPYNPEGIQFIENIRYQKINPGLLVNSHSLVKFDRRPEKVVFSNYNDADVIHNLNKPAGSQEISCKVGMATAAALFPVSDKEQGSFQVQIPLSKDLPKKRFSLRPIPEPTITSWEKALANVASLEVPDKKIQFLYDAAIRTLILLSADDVVPGPYTYRRFWFRDACIMLNAFLTVGMIDRTFRILNTFPDRQKITGYFQSQEGEWDSNGQVLWIMDRFQRVTGNQFNPTWMKAVKKGAEWIMRKRIRKQPSTAPHAGLLPPGFSAEHLGPNDYYYWDDFWGLAGLRGAARLAGLCKFPELQEKFESEAFDFEQSIFKSIDTIPERHSRGGIPASPYRRMDAGAIGSMVADYPLQLTPAGDVRIIKTAEFLMQYCFHNGAFFQDMIHSGINAYLTLDIAQTLLRKKDDRYKKLIRTVSDLATPTGQWPEAIHPHTYGGCMGDGQHGWAAAEWVMMIRNLFVREEGETLVLGSGIMPEWIASKKPVSFGPTRTHFGEVEVRFTKKDDKTVLEMEVDFSKGTTQPTNIIIEVPGFQKVTVADTNQKQFLLKELQT
jgi:hypothetical protein